MTEFKDFSDHDSLVDELTSNVINVLTHALKERSHASMVLSGGSTPKPFLKALRKQAQRALLDWKNIFLTLADERWVPTNHPDSNEKMVREILFPERINEGSSEGSNNNRLNKSINDARWISLKNESPNPHLGAAVTDKILKSIPKPFDVVILGMGDDGHTASIFPKSIDLSEALNPREIGLTCVGLTPPEYAPHSRITMTLPTLLNTKKVIVLITGEKKKSIYLKACESGPVEDLPIRALLRQQKTPVEIYWSPF